MQEMQCWGESACRGLTVERTFDESDSGAVVRNFRAANFSWNTFAEMFSVFCMRNGLRPSPSPAIPPSDRIAGFLRIS